MTMILSQNIANESKIVELVANTLDKSDGGELFIEQSHSESLLFEDSKLKSCENLIKQGFGLRAFSHDRTTFVHSSSISEEKIAKASQTIISLNNSKSQKIQKIELKNNNNLYQDQNLLRENHYNLQDKATILNQIDNYLRTKNNSIRQVKIGLSSLMQEVEIITKNGSHLTDIRPLIKLTVFVIIEKNGIMAQGFFGRGGRISNKEVLTDWQQVADKALEEAETNIEAIPSPAGEMPVVLSNGWCGILLHEAIGHGLESDFNRKKISAFSGLIGKKVATDAVTVIDSGIINRSRGSINIDDEGTPTKSNVLIDKGTLVSYMHDTMNAALMNTESTGNGRRESYAHIPMPRMTNTYMLAGDKAPQEIIASVKKGIYAVNFGGGQVDITSGKFVFSASKCYLIEDGKIKCPVKGATLIGNGPDILKKVSMVGNDMSLDPGLGTCGKEGQNIPVSVGQPSIKIDNITVGGTEV